MQSFLDQIIHILKAEFEDNISDICLVVPTRRAVVFLREALAKQYQETLWAPKMIAIQDLVREISGWQFPETMSLVFELYEVYLQSMQRRDPSWNEPLEKFYSWGEMLVKDFDELDKYCVNAEELFTNIKDLKEIELFFSLESDGFEPVRRFWETIRGRDEGPTEVQERFLKIWEVLFEIYSAYKGALAARHLAYDGMAYRYIADRLEAGEIQLPYKQLMFLGFNALSTAEERIIGHLLREGQGRAYWDVDESYFSLNTSTGLKKEALLTGEEPGKFIREYHQKWGLLESHLVLHKMLDTPKKIFHTGVPLQMGQAQYLGNLLQDHPVKAEEFSQIAIVLADEQLLFPVLYALPSYIETLNITMGFPLKQTQIYHLLLRMMGLLRNMQLDAMGEIRFPHSEVIDILNNPYVKALDPEFSEHLQQEIRQKNLVYIPQALLFQMGLSPLLKMIFDVPKVKEEKIRNLTPILHYCSAIFHRLLQDSQERKAYLEAEYIFHFYTQFNLLQSILDRYKPALHIQGFTKLFRELMQTVKIPFEGEPLVGVQLMGFLETRVLDFKKVYILAANEGSLPDTSTGNSFIPYNLRKGFGLPTYEEKDAIYAYHFYRLLQRPEEIHLIYNTVVNDSGGAKEVSRFIRQIRYFFRNQPNLQVEEGLVRTPVGFSGHHDITIPSTDQTKQKLLKRYSDPPKTGSEPLYLSATAINTWIGCRLRFYFKYIAGIKEPDQIEESMEASTFGTVLHLTMEYLYGPYLNQRLDKDILTGIEKELDSCLQRAFKEVGLGWGKELQGKNLLLKGVIEKLCRKIIQQDKQQPPFEVVSLEEDQLFLDYLQIGEYPIRLNGAFDRVDYLPDRDLIRILDYKTGSVELKKNKTLPDLFENDKLKETFQGYLYTWLYQRKFPDKKVIMGYYTARQLRDGIRYLNEGSPISAEEIALFEQELRKHIDQLLHEPYTQVEDEQKCGYCPYNPICNRARN